jgi:hypothetical protein
MTQSPSRDWPADQLRVQAHAPPALCVSLTPPSVAHEPELTTAHENREAMFSNVSNMAMPLMASATWLSFHRLWRRECPHTSVTAREDRCRERTRSL